MGANLPTESRADGRLRADRDGFASRLQSCSVRPYGVAEGRLSSRPGCKETVLPVTTNWQDD
jgi:hypothetical protein